MGLTPLFTLQLGQGLRRDAITCLHRAADDGVEHGRTKGLVVLMAESGLPRELGRHVPFEQKDEQKKGRDGQQEAFVHDKSPFSMSFSMAKSCSTRSFVGG